MSDPQLLSTRQVAEFVAKGYLSFPAVVPEDLNAAAVAEMDAIRATWGSDERKYAPDSGDGWDSLYRDPSAVGAVLRLPVVAGAIASLVGPNPVFDHDYVHFKPAGDPFGQPMHQDAMVDPTLAFDIQVFYFPEAVEEGGGGTGFVPGSHLRTVHETDVGRYQHVVGERQWVGPAGSVLIFHQGLWHRGMPNPSAVDRQMYKIRLNPTVPQVLLWDTSDLAEVQNGPEDHIFARFRHDSVAAVLRHRQPWFGEADYRLELANRSRVWRYLTGDSAFDVDWYLTRSERRAALSGGGVGVGGVQA